MKNRKYNTSTLLWAVTLPPGPSREWKNSLCTVEEEHLPFYKGHPHSGKSSGKHTGVHQVTGAATCQSWVTQAGSHWLKKHPLATTATFKLSFTPQPGWQKKPSRTRFLNVDFKFASFHTSLGKKKKSVFKRQHFMKFRSLFFFRPQVKFTVLQYTNIPSSAWN